ncbi:LOW QUALITY PROTEIN: uncharacterized protein WM277_025494 [Molossus nigricans]
MRFQTHLHPQQKGSSMRPENQSSVFEFLLLGLTLRPGQQGVFFSLFLGMYLTMVLGNLLIILLIRLDSRLHTPMYFFLSHLAFSDISLSSVTVPKMLMNMQTRQQSISYVGCISQLYFFILFGSLDNFLLVVMAYDRYVAICHPLHYTTIMRGGLCVLLVCGSWMVASVHALFHTLLLVRLTFCADVTITHFFCDITALLKLSCSDISLNMLVIFLEGGFLYLLTLSIVLGSYIRIGTVILEVPSTKRLVKAFSTCGSHLFVVSLYYGTLAGVYFFSSSWDSKEIIASVMYTVVTRMLNPYIYSLRNSDIKHALKICDHRVNFFKRQSGTTAGQGRFSSSHPPRKRWGQTHSTRDESAGLTFSQSLPGVRRGWLRNMNIYRSAETTDVSSFGLCTESPEEKLRVGQQFGAEGSEFTNDRHRFPRFPNLLHPQQRESSMRPENQSSVSEFLLLGLPIRPGQQGMFFTLFLGMYLTTVLGNLLIILLIRLDSRLHTPMYFFLSHLAFSDISLSSVTVPKMLTNIQTQRQSISYVGCISQLCFFILFAGLDNFLLAVMAYDRYVAICHPLHYTNIMRKGLCTLLVSGSWVVSCGSALLHTLLLVRLSFCADITITHYFCDLTALLKLSCSDISLSELVIFTEGGVLLFLPLGIVLGSYIHIGTIILRVPSTKRLFKAFSTCGSHLSVVSLYYGTVVSVYFFSSSWDSKHIIASVMYAVVTPMLNPFIYSLRNRDIKQALEMCVSRLSSLSDNHEIHLLQSGAQ